MCSNEHPIKTIQYIALRLHSSYGYKTNNKQNTTNESFICNWHKSWTHILFCLWWHMALYDFLTILAFVLFIPLIIRYVLISIFTQLIWKIFDYSKSSARQPLHVKLIKFSKQIWKRYIKKCVLWFLHNETFIVCSYDICNLIDK